MQKCSLNSFPSWEDFLNEGLIAWKGKSLLGVVCKLAWGSTVYNLRTHRNNLKFGNQICSEEQILHHISWEVCTQVMRKCKDRFKASVSM